MIKIVLGFIVVLHTLALFTGCTGTEPDRLAWISVEKSPIKVIYIDKQGQLDPLITSKVFHIVGQTRFQDVPINSDTSVTIMAESHQSDTESNSDTTSLSINRSK